MIPRHPCAGGCGWMLPHTEFACPLCWPRLPQRLRARIANARVRVCDERSAVRLMEKLREGRDWFEQDQHISEMA